MCCLPEFPCLLESFRKDLNEENAVYIISSATFLLFALLTVHLVTLLKIQLFSIDAPIALFTVSFSHLHYNVIQRGREAISDQNYKISPKLPRIHARF